MPGPTLPEPRRPEPGVLEPGVLESGVAESGVPRSAAPEPGAPQSVVPVSVLPGGRGLPERVDTARLVLRRPVPGDADAHAALHTDPRLYAHAPWARLPDRAAAGARFADGERDWTERGIGYWTVTDRSDGQILGVAGVRPAAAGRLNLYYRLFAEVHGRGLAREAARATVAATAEWLPGRVVEAVILPGHGPSIRVAESAGLQHTGARRHQGDPAAAGESLVLTGPALATHESVPEPRREELLDLWSRVTEAGGSVGFVPGASRAAIERALAEHEEQMAAGRAVGVSLTDPGGVLLGWAWWVRVANPLLAHGRWLYRLMVDPDAQGRGLGAVLLAGAIGVARRDGAELLQLGYRSGSGLGRFYARAGFAEVGRIPGAIRVAPGDDRDDVTMARRTDGRPMRPDARL